MIIPVFQNVLVFLLYLTRSVMMGKGLLSLCDGNYTQLKAIFALYKRYREKPEIM